MHRRIRYNDDAQVLVIPFWWEPSIGAPTAVKLEVKDRNGDVLEAATATTLIAADTLSAATASGATSCALTTGKTYLPGDRVLLAGTRPEVVEVESYLSKTITFKHAALYAHANSSAVTPWQGRYVLDTGTTVADWPKGELVTLIWTAYDATPDLLTDTYEETGQVLVAAFDVPAVDAYFMQVYPNEYDAIEEDFDDLEEMARHKLAAMVSANSKRNIEMIREPAALREAFIHLIAWFAALRMGDTGADNAERAWKNAVECVNAVSAAGDLWFDEDQDDTEDADSEIADMGKDYIGPGRVAGF